MGALECSFSFSLSLSFSDQSQPLSLSLSLKSDKTSDLIECVSQCWGDSSFPESSIWGSKLGPSVRQHIFNFHKKESPSPQVFTSPLLIGIRETLKLTPLTVTQFFSKTVMLSLHRPCIFTSPFSRISLLNFLGLNFLCLASF